MHWSILQLSEESNQENCKGCVKMKRKYESPEIGITKFQLVDTITTVSVDNNYYVAAEQKQS